MSRRGEAIANNGSYQKGICDFCVEFRPFVCNPLGSDNSENGKGNK